MGWVRFCAGILSAATLAIPLYLLLQTSASFAISVTLLCGALGLACFVPFPAISRPARERVFYACAAYMVLIWFSTLAAFLTEVPHSLDAKEVVGVGLLFSVLSAFLTIYAYKRKRLRRSSGWAGYLEKG